MRFQRLSEGVEGQSGPPYSPGGRSDSTHAKTYFSKIQGGLPFWYRLTSVVPDKGPLNGCVSLRMKSVVRSSARRIYCVLVWFGEMELRGCVAELSYTTSNSAYGTDWQKGEYLRASFTQSTPYKGLPTDPQAQQCHACSTYTVTQKQLTVFCVRLF